MDRWIRALVCLGLFATGLTAQRYSFKRYDQNSGLANQDIRALFQDSAGFLWIGTENGLFRYDGRHFRAFTEAEGLPSSRVEAIHQTPDGTLWIGTRAGLVRLKDDHFEKVDFSGREAYALTSDSQGRLYIGSSIGLIVSAAPIGSTQTLSFRQYKDGSQKTQTVRGIAASNTGDVWYSCGRQLCRLEAGRALAVGPELGIPDDTWQSVVIDSQGAVWARSVTKLIELEHNKSVFVRRDSGLPEGANEGGLLLARDGQLWVPTIKGLARRKGSEWEILGKSRGLPMSSVACALDDHEGSLWIGLNGMGLVRWLGSPHWETWTEAEGLSSENIWGIKRDRAGVLWSVSDSGVNRLNEKRGQWESPEIRGLDQSQTVHLMQAEDGALWVTQRRGAVRIDLHRNQATVYGAESGLENTRATSISTGREGRVWVGTFGGLYGSARSSGSVHFEREILPGEHRPDVIYETLLDRKGRLWVASWDGLLRLESGQWTRFTTQEGLLSNHVTYLAEGKDGSLWIGYFDPVGLSRLSLEQKDRRWRHFTSKDGLRSVKAFFLGCDVRGWIWFGTDKGVEVFDGSGWRHFDETDGFGGAASSFWGDADGTVWLGTSQGIACLRVAPSGLPPRPSAAPTLLTSVVFGDRGRKPDGDLSIPWSERSLHVSFAAMTFVNEDTVRFRYRIAGVDRAWNETQSREANISSLPAGRFTFEVQATTLPDGQPGTWSGAPARVNFTIKPAWWFTWWFILGALLAAALLARAFWTWRVRNMLRRQKELEDAVSDRTYHLNLEKARAEHERDTVEKQKVEIERLFDESQQAARLKDEFLANMSHEIRTPMNGIIGMTQLVLDSDLSGEQREYLEIVDRSAGSLLAIVNDILDLSKVQAGKLDLQQIEMDPHEIVASALKIMIVRSQEKSLKLFSSIGRDVPHNVIGDPLRLRQILLNLLGNAVKFTEQGEVHLSVNLEDEANGPMLHFEIRDTGIGIAKEKLEFIFEPFAQSDGSYTRRYGGTGLGLAICSRFVLMMGGLIWVESELGKGSQFHFTIRVKNPVPILPPSAPAPAAELRNLSTAIQPAQPPAILPAKEAAPAPPPPPGVTPLHILLAEDNPVNQKLAAQLLRKRGHRVEIAANGVEAVRAFEQRAFDVILMDVQMPELDGLEATVAIRQRERTTGNHIPIVAVTSHAMRGDRERCLDAGMDDYITKPINPARLFAAIEAPDAGSRRVES